MKTASVKRFGNFIFAKFLKETYKSIIAEMYNELINKSLFFKVGGNKHAFLEKSHQQYM